MRKLCCTTSTLITITTTSTTLTNGCSLRGGLFCLKSLIGCYDDESGGGGGVYLYHHLRRGYSAKRNPSCSSFHISLLQPHLDHHQQQQQLNHHHGHTMMNTTDTTDTMNTTACSWEQRKTHKNIVLVHGCFGFASQFCLLEKKLLESGFNVLNYCYPSPRQSIERSSEELLQFLNEHHDRTEHVLSSVGKLWNQQHGKKNVDSNNFTTIHTTTKNQIPNVDSMNGNHVKQEYHFVTHSMGSMVVRRFLVMTLMKQLESSNQSFILNNPVLDSLNRQEMLNLIQISPLLSGNVRLARNLSFLLPLAKILRKYEHEPTIVEQLMMNDKSLSDDGKFLDMYWWQPHSPLFNKVKLTHVITSLSATQKKVKKATSSPSNRSNILSDLVLTYEEQTSRVPSHMKFEPVVLQSDHNSVLLRKQCIDKVLQILSD
ncbi:hypothetical protein FDP41_000660 [Naegleria fowleri]|uniref:AB hydrolase-1 domain-containing protein n=1 Tax=Naegleria fowleri TaxID=5763 RepID=A0A6A5CBV7_NAEFO|nr:uncharacterized protein FDP41_000660 [Naegleria fowleri]KAF0984761.1 hypothetical protein FDP41_000660 [Naegleria fowleri]